MSPGDIVMYKTGTAKYEVVATDDDADMVAILSLKSGEVYTVKQVKLVVVKPYIQKGECMSKFRNLQEVMFKAEYEGCCIVNKWTVHDYQLVIGKEFFSLFRKNAEGKLIWKRDVDAVHLTPWKTRCNDRVTIGSGYKPFVSERQWQFDVTTDYQIDLDRISEDLTKENPIALIRLSNSDTVFLSVKGSLEDKLLWCKGGHKFVKELKELVNKRHYFPNRYCIYHLESVRDVNAFMNIFRAVHMAPVRKPLRKKNTVMVSLQKISS